MSEKIQDFKGHKYLIYSRMKDAPDIEPSIMYDLVLVDRDFMYPPDPLFSTLLDDLAGHLNEYNKCEGAELIPLYNDNVPIRIGGMYLCLFEQRWG